MGRPENNPEYWRLKAEEARAIARNLRDAQAREHMLSAVRCYERLASLAERGPLLAETPKAANTPLD